MVGSRQTQKGFTIVELLIVIVVIGILAAITIVAYNGIQQRARNASIASDLRNVANQFEAIKAQDGSYPNAVPADFRPSAGNILQATATGGESFCVNLYQDNGAVRKSWDSRTPGVRDGLCSGIAVGSAAGGEVPPAPRGSNLAPNASQWTLDGLASVNGNTITPGSAVGATARSPLIRVDSPTTIYVGGDMYATQSSAHFEASGGFHVSISYFAADGTTPARNRADYTSNGCARSFALNTWHEALASCSFPGGPEVIYVRVTFFGTNNNYSSSDLQIRNPLVRVAG